MSEMSENVRKWLPTTRQPSAPVRALLCTEFAGDLSYSVRKLEGDLSGSMSMLN